MSLMTNLTNLRKNNMNTQERIAKIVLYTVVRPKAVTKGDMEFIADNEDALTEADKAVLFPKKKATKKAKKTSKKSKK